MLFSGKNESTNDTCYIMNDLPTPQHYALSERSQIWRTTYCMIPFLQKIQKKQIYRK